MKEAYKAEQGVNRELMEFTYTEIATGKRYILFETSIFMAEEKMYEKLGDYSPRDFTVTARRVQHQ